ncbi:MAG: hypothetical protein K2H26_01495, partial [Ruminococcus sp.]|nr:hypothetical protein [Ruminococcus sp.]
IKAVKESLTDEEIQKIRDYNYFTDIEFNPNKSVNTQAKSVAIIRLMLDMYNDIPDFSKDDFIAFHSKYVL